MGFDERLAILAAALILSVLPLSMANAQFGGLFPGQVNLPADDFTWIWGNRRETTMGRSEDFSVRGGELGFRCTLTGRLGPGNTWSRSEIRQLETDLSSSLSFVQASANAMYTLEQRRDIDWAILDCVKSEQVQTAERKQEQEDKARAKAERRREQRRAREQREQGDSD